MQNWTGLSRLRLWHVAVFCAAIFMAGMMAPTLTTAQSSSKEEVYRQLGLFGDIFQRVRESYVDEIDDGELIDVGPEELSIVSLPGPPAGTATDAVDVVIRIRNVENSSG